jgi:hypothetical protein
MCSKKFNKWVFIDIERFLLEVGILKSSKPTSFGTCLYNPSFCPILC